MYIKKIKIYSKQPRKILYRKKARHKPSGWALYTRCSFDISKEKFCVDKVDKDYINRKKVKDNCHYTGKFRGAAHSKANLNYKVQKEIPIIIHNASYDTHFILNQLAI